MRLLRLLLFVVIGLLLFAILVLANGTWGTAYGQTAGPTPTADNAGGASSNSNALSISQAATKTTVAPAENFDFRLTVQNVATQNATDVVVNDPLPGLLDLVNITASQGSTALNAQGIIATLGTLDAGQHAVITLSVRVKSTAPTNASLTNSAKVHGSLADHALSNASNSVTIFIKAADSPPVVQTANTSDWLLYLVTGLLLVAALFFLFLFWREHRST